METIEMIRGCFRHWLPMFFVTCVSLLLSFSEAARAEDRTPLFESYGGSWQQIGKMRQSGLAANDHSVPSNVVYLRADGVEATNPKQNQNQEPGIQPNSAIASEVPSSPCSKTLSISSSNSSKPLSAVDECSLKPKDVFKECDNCPEMIVVPAGDFRMGSPEDEPDRNKNESPQHKVTFARQFAVGRYAVTFDEWDACVAAGGCGGYNPSDQSWGRGRRPVIHVSWDDAQAYVAWLSRTTGKPYRLLTEAEREYVTRAGTATPFWFGATITLKQANFDGKHSYNNGPIGVGRGKTLPVDSFAPNPWGLYQVHGNVWDWVEDCFHDNYAGAPLDGTAWISGECDKRISRGGAWLDQPRFLRSAFRLADFAIRRYDFQGFRVARTLGP